MGLKLRWSQEIEHVMGKAGKCYGFEVKMVTGNRACNG